MKKNYSFWSLIPFIVGTVVGIGAYFKIGKILKATDGNSLIAISTWLVAIFIVFASLLVIAEFVSTKDNEETNGGIVYIIEKYTSISFAKYINIGLIYFYIPVLLVIESLVAAQFLFQTILGIHSDVLLIVSTVVILGTFMIVNGKSIAFGKVFQSGSLIIKLIPLTVLIIMGLIFKPLFDNSNFHLVDSFTSSGKVSWFEGMEAAMPAALFALDGWQWSANIANETEGGTKTYVRAIILGMLAISAIYILYTLGGLSVISAKDWANGGANGGALSIAEAFTKIFNSEVFSKIISGFIVVAALGGLNGYTVFYNRQIKSSAERGWLPEKFAEANDEGLSFNSAKFGFLIALIMAVVAFGSSYVFPTHFGTTYKNFDVTAAANVMSDIWSAGIFGIVYVIFAVIAFKFKNILDKEEKTFKLPKAVFYISSFVMMIGGLFGLYVNGKEDLTVLLIGIFLILLAGYFTPKGHAVELPSGSNKK